MRVLIVSDTHKKHENLITIMEKERPFDRMIHLGDAEGYEATILRNWQDVHWTLWQEIMTFSLNFRKKRKLKSED